MSKVLLCGIFRSFRYANSSITQNKDYIRELLKKEGRILVTKPKFIDEEELVKIALKSSPKLSSHRPFILGELVQKHPSLWRFISPSLKEEKAFLQKALAKNPELKTI